MATIKQVAIEAGVSIATVSHVINKTRYVSPELVEKVEEAIKRTGYDKKINKKYNENKLLRRGEVGIILPDLKQRDYAKFLSSLSFYLKRRGYSLSVHFHHNDYSQEKRIISNILRNKMIEGLIALPSNPEQKPYFKLLQEEFPLIFLERQMGTKEADYVLLNKREGIYKGCLYLLKSGHEKISLIHEQDVDSVLGYRQALEQFNLPIKEELLIENNQMSQEELEGKIKKVRVAYEPTAFLVTNEKDTLGLLKTLNSLGLEIPKDVSVVGYGGADWNDIVNPPLTTLTHDVTSMSTQVADLLLSKMDDYRDNHKEICIPIELLIQKSTQVIGKGPFGENPITPEEITISNSEAKILKEGNYKVGISFHYGGTALARLYESGIRQVFNNFGISIVSITDAHFDPELQVTQLEGLRMQNPDAIIAIPVDDEITSQKFLSLAEELKMIFISNIPKGMKKDLYAACVSVNERESGQNLAYLLGEHYKDEEDVKIGFIGHGAPFYGTHLRDAVALSVLRDEFNNIDIVEEQYFHQNMEKTYEICKQMLSKHPEIQGLYISWDGPALEAIKALKELNREDVDIFTFDLDYEIATYLAREHMVKGLSAQRPFDQGIAVGLATAKALLGQDNYKYIGVRPYTVEPNNLVKAWKEITHEPIPIELERLVKE